MIRYSLTDDEPTRPTRICFGLLSADEIEKMSVCEITETTLYYRGLPCSGGLLDPLMGSVDRRHLCASCMKDAQMCQGHPGHMCLPFPCYHIGFVDTVLKILRTTCFFCSRVCVLPDDMSQIKNLTGKQRFQAVHNQVRVRKTCPHCEKIRPAYSRSPYGIRAEWPPDHPWECAEEEEYCTQPFTARDALSILRNVPPEDLSLLGFDTEIAHPMNMIVQNLVVPPPCTRPAIYSSEGSRSRGQNDLTVRLAEILKRSHELRNFMKGVSWEEVDVTPEFLERLHRLQYEVYIMVNNSSRIQKPAGMGRSGGSMQIKSLTDRLKGKEGRIRGNLMGKRVDFSARCVITPDAYFECDRVGVPYGIAMNLTIPETVNISNLKQLTERVRLGTSDVRGAATVISASGVTTSLAYCRRREDIVLKTGDIVERFLQDDDVVVFNRQPSLHMHGMLAHRVRLMPGHTFRISLVVAAPYNADFDGDEMNLHVPQSKVASTECAMLMGVTQHCINSQSNKPVMGIVQDSLLGLYLLSRSDSILGYADVCRLIGTLRNTETSLPPADVVVRRSGKIHDRLWTGRSVFSLTLPKGLYLEASLPSDGDGDWNDDTLPVIVRDGRLVCGVLRKAHVGTSAGGIVDVICREHGGVVCMRFMANAQRLTHAFLLQKGHHVGIDDVMFSSEGQTKVNARLTKATLLCEEIQKDMTDASAEVQQKGERAILRLLGKMLLQTGGIVNELMEKDNAIRRMVNAGSKGSFINLSQICACLGQQSLEGSRIVAERERERTLPYYAHNDLTLASRGMVFNSFSLGLSPTELFYHAIGGREGLVDTAVKTSQTGYLQRRMNKSMEDHTLGNDGTIRNAMSEVVSFVWGSDGMNPCHLQRVRMHLVASSEDAWRHRFTPEELCVVRRARAQILRAKTHVLATEVDARVLLPFHPERLKDTLRRASTGGSDVADADRVWSTIADLDKGIPQTVVLALVDVFCRRNVVGKDRKVVDALLEKTLLQLERARTTHGESAGCIAAQSIGEPATQMTLNTFHLAGCASKNVTLGIPRLKELLDTSKASKTPCTTIRFRRPFSSNKEFAEYFANTLSLTRLGDIVSETRIQEHAETRAANDWMMYLDQFLADTNLCNAEGDISDFVIRLVLNKDFMKSRRLTPPMIRTILSERLSGRAIVSSTEVNSVDWLMHVRFFHVKDMVKTGGLSSDQQMVLCHRAANILMDTVVVGGHLDITGVSVGEMDVAETGGQEFVVNAYGHFLSDCVASDCVDWTRSTSNDIWETYTTFGIEACCHVFFDQLKAVVSFDGTYVDDRHMLLIVDTVFRNGNLMPLNRHGINRTDSSPLMRASFEETTDVLCEASIFAESENARGVTAAIMMGQLAGMGTGVGDVLFANRYMNTTNTTTIKKKGRTLRSTCRCQTFAKEGETLEYIVDDGNNVTGTSRPLSPVGEETRRKRARFRTGSPKRH